MLIFWKEIWSSMMKYKMVLLANLYFLLLQSKNNKKWIKLWVACKMFLHLQQKKIAISVPLFCTAYIFQALWKSEFLTPDQNRLPLRCVAFPQKNTSSPFRSKLGKSYSVFFQNSAQCSSRFKISFRSFSHAFFSGLPKYKI